MKRSSKMHRKYKGKRKVGAAYAQIKCQPNQTTNNINGQYQSDYELKFFFKVRLTLKVSPVFTLTEICSRDAEISVTQPIGTNCAEPRGCSRLTKIRKTHTERITHEPVVRPWYALILNATPSSGSSRFQVHLPFRNPIFVLLLHSSSDTLSTRAELRW